MFRTLINLVFTGDCDIELILCKQLIFQVFIFYHLIVILNIFFQDSPDPLANSLLQPQFPGTLVLELDWLPLRTDKNDPLVLCIAGADGSFRLVDINV
jgi:hypothetical protein